MAGETALPLREPQVLQELPGQLVLAEQQALLEQPVPMAKMAAKY